ncbi:MAG TPA: Gfo/Idh/MocA family oxidoreductase [Planctomycetota bacterium]|nr:Gfo/Idh/MocA family oxidoreductase [Planctomycetota bacterium]HRR79798.1 Gfo/Idh/MocA family oxidoreductase [Planctomycetota bacterium]HRT94171.1 Gfo/Idh/MocA family oxidoreductase [Planctomycetota bacterium]
MAVTRVGILGSGGWAGRYGAALQESKKVKLVAVAGGSRAPAYAEKLGIRHEPTVGALCEARDVDLVVIATPHGLHARHAVLAAEHGKHILVEKPMATSVAECDQMIKAADQAGVKLMVAHSRRFFPLVKQAKALLDEGAIGRILMLRQLFSHNARTFGTKEGHWMSDPRLSMGFFIGYGCHQLDMTLHLVGSRVRAVMARFGNYWADSPIENCGALFLDFESGAYSTFMEVCSMPNELKAWPPFPDYHEVNELIGERGLMLLRPYQKLALRNGRDGDDWKTLSELTWKEADNPTIFLREEVEALADAVANGTEPPVTAAEGRHCVEIIQAAYESSRTGKAVYLPL